jgi:hypothetical protein
MYFILQLLRRPGWLAKPAHCLATPLSNSWPASSGPYQRPQTPLRPHPTSQPASVVCMPHYSNSYYNTIQSLWELTSAKRALPSQETFAQMRPHTGYTCMSLVNLRPIAPHLPGLVEQKSSSRNLDVDSSRSDPCGFGGFPDLNFFGADERVWWPSRETAINIIVKTSGWWVWLI